jgi:DNA-binding XRE family transcriptional regulator
MGVNPYIQTNGLRYNLTVVGVKSDYGAQSVITMFAMPFISCKEARREIALRVRDARLNSGLKQSDVAEVLNISQSSYSRMERGILMPDVAQIRTLSGLHGVSILWLLGMPSYFVYADQSSSSSSSS